MSGCSGVVGNAESGRGGAGGRRERGIQGIRVSLWTANGVEAVGPTFGDPAGSGEGDYISGLSETYNTHRVPVKKFAASFCGIVCRATGPHSVNYYAVWRSEIS